MRERVRALVLPAVNLMVRKQGAFILVVPDAGPPPVRTTISWDTGDGTRGVVAVVDQVQGREEMKQMSTGPSGSVEVEWVGPGRKYQFRLYTQGAWDSRDQRPPRELTRTTFSMDADERREVVADVVFLSAIMASLLAVGFGALGTLLLGRRLVARMVRAASGR